MPDAPRLAHDPGMQMEHHQPADGDAVGIKTIEPFAPQEVDFVDRAPAVQVDVVVVEIRIDAERVELPGLGGHLVRLLVVAPVTHVADTFRRQEVGGVWRLLEVGAGTADRPCARSLFDRLDRGANVLPLLVLGHADMDDAPPRETMRNELGVALQPLFRSGPPPLSARCPELLPVLAHDRSRRSNPNADAAPLIDECTFSRDPPHDILGCQYERHPLTTFTPTPASCRDSVRRVANLLRNYSGMPGGR